MSARAVLRADAVFHAVVALLLLGSTWDGLYTALDLPRAAPALFTQVGGAGLVALAYLLWASGGAAALVRPVAGAAAVANALAAAIVVVWLIRGGIGIQALGNALLAFGVALLVGFALAEARIVRGAT